VDASAIRDGGTLYVFAVNRALDDTAIVEIEMADAELASLQEGKVLTAISAKSANSFDQPDTVAPRTLSEIKISQGEATVALPPLSFTAMTFDLV
jgi:alpha-N-arabinofuranosidase